MIWSSSSKYTAACAPGPGRRREKQARVLGAAEASHRMSLLGGIVVRNTLVTYDRYNHQIGFLKTNCTDLESILPAETKPPVNTSSPSKSPTTTPHPPDSSPSTRTPFPYAEREFGSIELLIQVAANLTTFSNQGSLFLSSMSTELGISQSQITIEDLEEEEGHAVVRCMISAGPLEHFSSSSARALAARFERHTVQLPAIFGDYRLRSWKGVPPANSWG